MKDVIRKELTRLVENNVYGQEGISKKVAELTDYRDRLVAERDRLNAEIRKVNGEIKRWQIEISPNQTSMFDDL
jgi:hypothetical protein